MDFETTIVVQLTIITIILCGIGFEIRKRK